MDDPSQTKVSGRGREGCRWGAGGVRVGVGQRAGRFLVSHWTAECRFSFLTALQNQCWKEQSRLPPM